MQALPHGLPVTTRLPLIAAVMIFLVAITSTQIAIFAMAKQSERQVEALGQVYLDGLSAALLPHVMAGDQAATRQVFHQALDFHHGVVDRRLVFIDTSRRPVADIARNGVADNAVVPANVGLTGNGMVQTPEGYIWIWRELEHGGQNYGVVAANLDVSAFEGDRNVLRVSLLLFDLVFSGICAVIGFFMVQRMQRPVTMIAQHLYDAATGAPKAIDESHIPHNDPQAARMFHAFNAMTHASKEREKLLSHIAEQEREAVLGRIVATLAHEVRNPLGGMRTAISTLKRFGERPDTREEAVGFLDRGVRTLEEVVNATLASHRARPRWRWLSRQDFEDLRVLVDADGRSRDVSIAVDLDMEDEVPVAALEVRQVLLNLLLNAVRASPDGGMVRLEASTDEHALSVVVSDQGSGLNEGLVRAIETGTIEDETPGLGVEVVTRLVKRLDGQLTIETASGLGTRISIRFPFQKDHVPT